MPADDKTTTGALAKAGARTPQAFQSHETRCAAAFEKNYSRCIVLKLPPSLSPSSLLTSIVERLRSLMRKPLTQTTYLFSRI